MSAKREIGDAVNYYVVKKLTFERDNFTCQLKLDPRCTPHENLTFHHKLPRFKGGRDTPENGITACRVCHDIADWEAEHR